MNHLTENYPDLIVANILCPYLGIRDLLLFGQVSRGTHSISQHDLFWSHKIKERKWRLDCIPIDGQTLVRNIQENLVPTQEMTLKSLRMEVQLRGLKLAGLFEKGGAVQCHSAVKVVKIVSST